MPPHREEVLKRIEEHREEIRSFGVRSLGLFGSVARGEARPESDLDFLVEFDRKTFRGFMGLKFFLESLFECRVDLATGEMLKIQTRAETLREVVQAKGF